MLKTGACHACGDNEVVIHICPVCESPVCDECSNGVGTACFSCEGGEAL